MPYKNKKDKKAWHERNREKELIRMEIYRKLNKEKIKIKRKEQYKLNREKEIVRIIKYHKANPEKRKARDKINDAIKAGVFPKPTKCVQCGTTSSESKIDYHHKNYSEPFNVIDLCKSCHMKLHRALPLKLG